MWKYLHLIVPWIYNIVLTWLGYSKRRCFAWSGSVLARITFQFSSKNSYLESWDTWFLDCNAKVTKTWWKNTEIGQVSTPNSQKFSLILIVSARNVDREVERKIFRNVITEPNPVQWFIFGPKFVKFELVIICYTWLHTTTSTLRICTYISFHQYEVEPGWTSEPIFLTGN